MSSRQRRISTELYECLFTNSSTCNEGYEEDQKRKQSNILNTFHKTKKICIYCPIRICR